MLIGKKTITALTAPGNAETFAMGEHQPASAEVEITLATIDTSATLKIEYSNDNFSTTAASKPITAYTANGTYCTDMAVGYTHARLVFVSEAGGSAVTVNATYRMFTN